MNDNTLRRDRARKLLDSGQTGEALALLDKNIKDSPKDVDSIYLSGICYARSGNLAAAEKRFNKAVKMSKGLFQAYTDLGLSQSFQHKYTEAIKSFKKSIAINPVFAPAHFNIALAYIRTKEAGKALQHAKKSVEIDGRSPSYRHVLALCYRELKQTARAIDTLKEINAAYPDFYGAFYSLYETYRLIHDIPNAEKALLSAKEIFGDQASVYLSLGKLYEQTSRTETARDLYAEGIAACADNLELLIALGRANRILGNVEDGLGQIDKALGIDSTCQPALAERCSFHILQGEYDKAYTLLHSFISSNPDTTLTPGLSMAYAHTCRLTGRHEESIRASRDMLQTSGISDEMKSVVLFSMGDSYDGMKKYDRAFNMYRKANSVTATRSDIDRHLEVLGNIRSNISKAALDRSVRSESHSVKPVFIVGMPRSGTSLAEQIIASHPEAYGAGEITELWSIGQEISENTELLNYTEKLALLGKERINRYAERYLAYIESLDPNASRITDKLPHNFMHIGLIKQLFPEAPIIHCHRHPFDTCLSIYFKRFNDSHLYARSLSEIARFYLQYRQIMNLWDAMSVGIFNLKYEDLVRNQENITRDMISHIGLGWDESCLRYHESFRLITTPSYTQANKPVYTASINRWRNYESHLGPLIDVLGSPEQYD